MLIYTVDFYWRAKMVPFGCAILSFLVMSINAQNSCTTPGGKTGQCIPIKECSTVLRILKDSPKPLPQEIRNLLRESHCGSNNATHLVCCAQEVRAESGFTATNHPNLNLLPKVCGVLEVDSIIGGGDKAALFDYPWMALLGYQTGAGIQFKCGGSLINSRYVLTAAHCVTRITDTLVSVRLGEHDLSKDKDCEQFDDSEEECAPPVLDINVEKVISHPEYNIPRFANDIALIRLSQEAVFSDAVQPICLPVTEESLQANLTRALISGWGFTEKFAVKTPDVLLKAIVPIVQNDVCQQLYERSIGLSDKQLCAGGEPGNYTCKGDSGGPLFYAYFKGNGRARNTQFGILSAGGVSCGEDQPDVFTRVASYSKWILDQLQA